MSRPVILASSSPYRRDLLARVLADFACATPAIDETPAPGETPAALVERLAESKARALGSTGDGDLVIGSDQVAALDGEIIGKPGNADRAFTQLRRQAGRTLCFYTAVAVLDTAVGHCDLALDITRVTFRSLTDSEIHRYLARERPYDCAGSFKAEGLGIALFERIQSEDPTALTGLPLIQVTSLLRKYHVEFF